MATTGVLERRPPARPTEPDHGARRRDRRRALLNGKRALVVLAVIAASLIGGYIALANYTQSRLLSVGEIALAVDPGHRGALDLYVPLVDWGVRFEDTIRLPARLRVDLRTVDRGTAARIAEGQEFDLQDLRGEARDHIAAYLRALIAIVVASAAALGLLVAFAVRHHTGPRLRYTTVTALGTAVALGVAMVALLPPRGEIDEPQYYAFGPDIPRALEAVESAQRSTNVLDQELDSQLVGLARLVTKPAERVPLDDRPRITLASDLHNNFLAIDFLDRAHGRGPLFFAGDLTDRGSPLETRLVRQVVDLGDPFVFVSGNHDSDTLQLELARRGAIVLTDRGRLNPDGSYGDVIVEVAGLRVAGYSDPFERRAGENFRDRFEAAPSDAQQQAFTAWLMPKLGQVDIVMVHAPGLIEHALDVLRNGPPVRPLVFLVGHTHKADLDRSIAGVTILNAGSVGAGGAGNLKETTNIGLAQLLYGKRPRFRPLAADVIEIDPGNGSATARRERLDEPARD